MESRTLFEIRRTHSFEKSLKKAVKKGLDIDALKFSLVFLLKVLFCLFLKSGITSATLVFAENIAMIIFFACIGCILANITKKRMKNKVIY